MRASRGVHERRVIGQEINSADKVASWLLVAATGVLRPGSALDPEDIFP